MGIKFKVNINPRYFDKIKQLQNDKEVMTAIHNTMARRFDKYVPFDTGLLSQTTQVTDKYVRYNQPYAHYMYEGVVYGPNIPIIENGEVVGFYSRPGVKKTPTGEYMNYDKSHHPLATRHWDEAMMRTEGDAFNREVEEIIKRRIEKL